MCVMAVFVLLLCVYSFPEGTDEDLLKSCHLVCTALFGNDDVFSLFSGEKPNRGVYV